MKSSAGAIEPAIKALVPFQKRMPESAEQTLSLKQIFDAER
jgi:hypothetical protein